MTAADQNEPRFSKPPNSTPLKINSSKNGKMEQPKSLSPTYHPQRDHGRWQPSPDSQARIQSRTQWLVPGKAIQVRPKTDRG